MRLKYKEIAKELGISPATVSLAINNRPGVNEQTRKKVLDYINQKDHQLLVDTDKVIEPKGTVMIVNYIKSGSIMNRSDHPALKKIEEMLIEKGYRYSYQVFHEDKDDLKRLIEYIRSIDVKGIYLMAAEMQESDIYPFLELSIPLVSGDRLFYGGNIDGFLIDNQEGIRKAVGYLIDKGHHHIIYLAENIDIYNFNERREAFMKEMLQRGYGDSKNRIHYLGSNLDDVYHSMKQYLNKNVRATAMILESSVVSLGVSKALLEKNIRIPRDISLIGFDVLPPESLLGIEVTVIKGTHTKRHLEAVKHLVRKIEDENEETICIYYRPALIEGNSVFDKKKYIYN